VCSSDLATERLRRDLAVPVALVARSTMVKLPDCVGVPLIRPVAELMERPAGRPVALNEVAGRTVPIA